ncbi:MAG TPA: tetratricopeptide repeat protein [Chitinophagaceae bacterium]
MKTTTKIKPQLVLVAIGVILFSLLFIFGRTVPPRENTAGNEPVAAGALSFTQVMQEFKKGLQPYQQDYLLKLENAVKRGDVKEQQIHTYHQIAGFWRDTMNAYLPYAWYTAEAAKLENSEKSLTFAAHLLENRLLVEQDPSLLTLLATNAKELFESALKINPSNDSTIIGLGACYIFGNISGNPMQGILPITEITKRDPANIYAQKVLALGGMKSGQYDKAIDRLKIILAKDPANMEIIFRLAEAYEGKGDKANAVTQYRKLKELVDHPQAKEDIQHRIEELEK